jgi:ATP-dependent RNA helicase SUPV3L1/SUV3
MQRSLIVAALGPTNTGKTFRALARMREHESGMIGLPLRLLAREVYDKLVSELGCSEVALITGEEKLIPRSPRYWVCTVEAMPVERDVDFLAVDEIQLVGHHERGHLFTERLLHARGRKETWFIGSETMVGVVRRLVPTAEFLQFPRLSRLRCEGSFTLASLPPRSAVVAFSVPRVYEIAERIRAKRGGVAIVLGALSPRARNAQVAMYQAGEVDYLVATDAIGLGLNLDIDRVAFADTRKFDGRQERALDVSELAQIAGRAGRYHTDGAFGTLSPRPPFSVPVATAIEQHTLGVQKRVYYRNSDLDFSSPRGLVGSLRKPPSHPGLELAPEPVDAQVLVLLLNQERIRALVTDESQLRLLWQICQIPDYRKLMIDEHAWLIGEIFRELSQTGALTDDYLRQKILRLREHSGDIDAIVGRIASVRTWAYVTQHASWVQSDEYQAQTREIEDALSDELHRALVERFVSKTKRKRERDLVQKKRDRSLSAQLADLRAKLDGDSREPEPSWIDRVLDAHHTNFNINESGSLEFEGVLVAALIRGRKIGEPGLRFSEVTEHGPPGRQRTLEEHLRKVLQEKLGAFFHYIRDLGDSEGSDDGAALRGISYQLAQGLGSAREASMRDLIRALSSRARVALHSKGILIGRRFVYCPQSLSPQGQVLRQALLSAFTGNAIRMGTPESGLQLLEGGKSAVRMSSLDWERLGYEPLGDRALRLDLVEKFLVEKNGKTARAREALIMNTLGVDADAARRVGRLLGAGGAPRRSRRRKMKKSSSGMEA